MRCNSEIRQTVCNSDGDDIYCLQEANFIVSWLIEAIYAEIMKIRQRIDQSGLLWNTEYVEEEEGGEEEGGEEEEEGGGDEEESRLVGSR